MSSSFEFQHETGANALHKVEELRGPSVDSYDKLIAWLAEMAETDNVHLDTSVFVSQLNRVCGGGSQANRSDASGTSLCGAAAGGGGSSCGGSSRRAPNLRQNSSSYESHASSEMLTQRQRGSSRSDDFLDPKSAWRSGGNSRQTTFSDDLEEEGDEMKKTSMESLYSSADKDVDLGNLLPYDSVSKSSGRVYNTAACPSLLRAGMHSRFDSENRCLMGPHMSSSMGNLLYENHDNGFDYPPLPATYTKRRSVSLLNLKPPNSINHLDNIPKLVLTKEDEDPQQAAPLPELKTQRKTPKPVQKSLSLNTWTRRRGKLQKQMSLQVEPNLKQMSLQGEPNLSPFYPFSQIIPVIPPLKGPAAAVSETPVFLDDTLLDGNLEDILYCVEALWPKK
uniref:Uncharacterized protein n=1 Tax=Biomphalaria glabrata TaxID=6526 RepID=A0A2C9KKL0_BIOGL